MTPSVEYDYKHPRKEELDQLPYSLKRDLAASITSIKEAHFLAKKLFLGDRDEAENLTRQILENPRSAEIYFKKFAETAEKIVAIENGDQTRACVNLIIEGLPQEEIALIYIGTEGLAMRNLELRSN